MKKRLCIDINSILPLVSRGYLTGVGRSTYELVTALDNMKEDIPFDIVLYSQNTKNISSKNLGFSFESKHLPLPYREAISKLLSFFSVRERLTKADLWHCPHNSDIVDDLDKTLFTIHDLIILNCKNEFPKQEVEKVKKELPQLLDRCKGIITCSESSKRDIIRFFDINPDKIQVTYWGVNHTLFKPLPDKERLKGELTVKFGIKKPYFFSVSCGYGRKNTVELIKAYNLLVEQTPVNDLVLIWNNYGHDIEELIKNNPRIHVLKNIGDEDLMKLYNAATSLFFPSSYEGFGLPILEAMACGIPVVTCRNSSLVEIGSDIAIYTDTEDAQGILKVMEKMENKQYKTEDIIVRGLKYVSGFTWEKCARETLTIYNHYLNK